MFNKDRKKKGGQTALTESCEEKIVKSVVTCAKWGYPLSVFDLQCFVKYHLDREGKIMKEFKNNPPGPDWAQAFIKRYKDTLAPRMCQNISQSRAKVTPQDITNYSEELKLVIDGVFLQRKY